MLPDRSVLIGQKLVENAKIQMGHFESFSKNVPSRKLAFLKIFFLSQETPVQHFLDFICSQGERQSKPCQGENLIVSNKKQNYPKSCLLNT